MSETTEGLASIVVLTGSFGSGKSSAAKCFAALGASVISADLLAREVVEPGTPALAELTANFGSDILDENGKLQRKKLAELVFKDEHKRKRLEAITHPRIHELALSRFAAEKAKHPPLIVYECPLFFESALDKKGFGAVIAVICEDSLAISRVMARDGLSKEAVLLRLKQQLPAKEKAARSDYVIHNDGTLAELEASVTSLYATLANA